MSIGILEIKLYLAESHSLKSKRHLIRPLVNDIKKQFNVAVAETNYLDIWQSAQLTCVTVSNDSVRVEQVLQQVLKFVTDRYSNLVIEKESIEIIT